MKKSGICHAIAMLVIAIFFAPPAANAASKGEDTGGGYKYVELAPIYVPVIDGNGISQVVNLIVALEVENSSAVAKAERLQPKLTDAFIQDMYGALAKQAMSNGGLLQLSVIKKRLLKVSNRILSEGSETAVHDVLLQMLDQRRI